MSFGVRIFLVYFLFVGLAGYFVLSTVRDEIRPGVRQSTEETLVDTANLLAEILREDVKNGTLDRAALSEVLRAYGQRQPEANIWGIKKTGITNRIYVTDRSGLVILDSSGQALGQDYSHWNDVHRTLRGEYGARSTTEPFPEGPSTVMYVAAPIIDSGKIIGVVSVAKPNRSLQPYIDRSQERLTWLGAGLVLLGLVVGALLSWWLGSSLRRLTGYAEAVSAGHRVEIPRYTGGELAQLAAAIERMRVQLEGKAYIERYVETLTHELKSPLAAIRGAAELLQNDVPSEQRKRFIANIDSESLRLQRLVERLLDLALVEQRQALDEHVPFSLRDLVVELIRANETRILGANHIVENAVGVDLTVCGEPFLVFQAVSNLLDNALDFTPNGGTVSISASRVGATIRIAVENEGELIPEYALSRLTERFYSLPRPNTGRKSTGLGLNFVQEVAELHGGSLYVHNVKNGVEAILILPSA